MDLDPKDYPGLYDALRARRALLWAVMAVGAFSLAVGAYATFFRDDPQWALMVAGFSAFALALSALFPLSERDRRAMADMRRQRILSGLAGMESDAERERAVHARADGLEGAKRERYVMDLLVLADYRCIGGVSADRHMDGSVSLRTGGSEPGVRVLRDTFSRDVRPLSEQVDESMVAFDAMDDVLRSMKMKLMLDAKSDYSLYGLLSDSVRSARFLRQGDQPSRTMREDGE